MNSNHTTSNRFNPISQPFDSDPFDWALPPCTVQYPPYQHQRLELATTGLEAVINLLARHASTQESEVRDDSLIALDEYTHHGLLNAARALIVLSNGILSDCRHNSEQMA
jgi:hypothetical protein